LEHEIAVSEATGGLLHDLPVICGGYTGSFRTDACKVLGKNITGNMKEARLTAASIVYNGKLLVTGGFNGGILSSTEWLTIDNNSSLTSEKGEDLPEAMGFHCLEEIKSSNGMLLIGGITSSTSTSSSTWFKQDQARQWEQGPDLNIGRSRHASAVIASTSGAGEVVIVSGGWTASGSTDTVEIMKTVSSPQIWKWEPGKLVVLLLFFGLKYIKFVFA